MSTRSIILVLCDMSFGFNHMNDLIDILLANLLGFRFDHDPDNIELAFSARWAGRRPADGQQ